MWPPPPLRGDGAFIVTVTEASSLPHGPTHSISKVVLAVRLLMGCLPDVDLVPVQPLDAVQDVALVAVHSRVVPCPLVTEAGDAVKVTTGGGPESSTLMPNVP